MHRLNIVPLSSSADAGELRAILAAASPGSAFSVRLDASRYAVIALCGVQCNAPATLAGVPPGRGGQKDRGRAGKSDAKNPSAPPIQKKSHSAAKRSPSLNSGLAKARITPLNN